MPGLIYDRIMPDENKRSAKAPALPEANGTSPAPPVEQPAPLEPSSGDKCRPFSYITYENVTRLAYLLRKEPPQVTAVVLAHLKPEFTQRILAWLPLALKVAVIQESAKIRTMSAAQIHEIDTRIKEAVDLVFGGWEQAAALLENADEKTRSAIFEQLRRDNFMVYDKLRKTLFRFEDSAKIPFESMVILIPELNNNAIAAALSGASPGVINKFRASMPSEVARKLLLETIQFEKPSPADIQTARKEIIQVIRKLEKEGRIVLDADGARAFLGDLDEEAAPMPEVKPAARVVDAQIPTSAEAVEHLSAGNAHYQGGRFEKSVECFQTALNLDPSLWQAHQGLGGASYALNRLAEARMHYEKLLQIHPDPALAQWYETFKKYLS